MKLTPEMKEIALKTAEDLFLQNRYDAGDYAEFVTLFAERFLAALPKPEPTSVTCQIYGYVVGACSECNTHAENDVNETNKVLADNYLKLTCGTNTKETEQRVAEACAKRFDQMADEAEVDLAFSALVEYFRENASAFRSGKWRDFL